MTEEELGKIPFRFTGHLSMEGEHCSTYESIDGRLGVCHHVPFKDGEPYGRAYTHYRIDKKVYKTRKKFIEALKDFEL